MSSIIFINKVKISCQGGFKIIQKERFGDVPSFNKKKKDTCPGFIVGYSNQSGYSNSIRINCKRNTDGSGGGYLITKIRD